MKAPKYVSDTFIAIGTREKGFIRQTGFASEDGHAARYRGFVFRSVRKVQSRMGAGDVGVCRFGMAFA